MAIFNAGKAPGVVATIRRYFPEVNRVADATKHVKVSVTGRDCNTAKERTFNRCAMAKACERELHLDGAVVRPGVAYLIKGDLAVRYLVPQSVRNEIISFDRHGDFRPGEYFLSPPPRTNQIGAERRYKLRKSHASKNIRPRGKVVGIRSIVAKDGV